MKPRWCMAAWLLLAVSAPASAIERQDHWLPVLAAPDEPATAPDRKLWAAIRDTGYRELFELFLEKYPSSPDARHARDALAVIDGQPTPTERAAADAAFMAVRVRSPVPLIFVDPSDDGNVDVAKIQRALVARGCNAGPADGIWGSRSAGAARRFVRSTGLRIDGSTPSALLANAVTAATGDICGDFDRSGPPVATGAVTREREGRIPSWRDRRRSR